MSEAFERYRGDRIEKLRELIETGRYTTTLNAAAVPVVRRRSSRVYEARGRFVASELLLELPVVVSIGNRDFTPPEWRLNPEAFVE